MACVGTTPFKQSNATNRIFPRAQRIPQVFLYRSVFKVDFATLILPTIMHRLVDFHPYTGEAMIDRVTSNAQIANTRNGVAGQMMFSSIGHYCHHNKLELRLSSYL